METKYCPRCERDLDINLFNFKDKSAGTRQSACRECHKKIAKEHYRANKPRYIKLIRERDDRVEKENRILLLEYLRSHPCVDCKESDPVVLQFDHVRGTKKKAVSDLMKDNCGWTTISKEIDKCDVRCANCHLRRTSKQFGHWKSL